MELCEVRVPTYKRPRLLERALKSLIAQDYCCWKAIVMDDSPAQEAKPIVDSLADDRIIYSPNSQNLGSAGNLDRAFASHSLVDGTYACVLEDDNWLLPNYLSENISSLKRRNVTLLLRNQQIWTQTEHTSKPTGRTTRGDWFASKIYDPFELHAHLFFFETISNGGLFWKTSIKTQLQVGIQVSDAGLQEYCRALQIQDHLLFEPEPLCCWAEMPSNLSLRNPAANRVFGRGVQAIKMKLIETSGSAIIQQAEEIARDLNKLPEFEQSLVDALYISYSFKCINKVNAFKQYCKSYARYLFVENPLQAHFEAKYAT